MTVTDGRDDLTVGDRYYILASSVAADLPRVVLKHDGAFLVADRRGDFPRLPRSEFGFYVDDTRFLHALELRLAGERPILLNAAVAEDAEQVTVELTNGDLRRDERLVLRGRSIRVARRLGIGARELRQSVTLENFSGEPQEFELGWEFAADFADVFEVRGVTRDRRGTALPPECEHAGVRLGYRGLDGVVRTTRIAFSPAPVAVTPGSARYRLTFPPGGRVELSMTIAAEGAAGAPSGTRRRRARPAPLGAATLETSHQSMNRWLARARADVRMLLTDTSDGPVPYAGIPWFVAPFGRDSEIAALQVLPFEPEIARGTLRFLARYQGRTHDDFTDQEPGKILHEYRRGEMAACREIVFIPYYGSVDATPLFIILLAEYLRWTGDEDLVRALWPAFERALGWIRGNDGRHGDAFLTYIRRSPRGLDNQGWKDAQDAVMHDSGALAPPPIALVEVQAYKHAALLGAAEIAATVGRGELAGPLRHEARQLAERFEREFWLEPEAFYALALDGHGQPCRVITSNPGHCLWTGLARPSRAGAVVKRLMATDVFSGWGIRTLAAGEQLYNPMSYHNGSVWPHDTAIAAVGMRRYGFIDSFLTLATGLFEAVLNLEGLRLPELLCGFPRAPGFGPTRYPVACSPQAWSAGAVFQLVGGMLGLEADAAENRLTLNEPILPPWLDWIAVRGLRIRHSSLDLLVSRGRQQAAVELLDRRGDAELVVKR
jgi:glycogen debranching enzyme